MEGESTAVAYDRFAAIYDEFNAANDYEMWLGERLLPALERHGLKKGWALDIGCGTGRAFEPLLSRGWRVAGCDVSPGMLKRAAEKFGSRVELFEADARELPPVSSFPGLSAGEGFELILALNDVANYLTGNGDLERFFAGVKPNLSREGGLFLFDTNAFCVFREAFTAGRSEEMSARGWDWYGLTENADRGAVFEARLSGQGVEAHVHRERHWTPEQVKKALEASGLRCLAALGQREDADNRVILESPPDEDRHYKIVYIAGHKPREKRSGTHSDRH